MKLLDFILSILAKNNTPIKIVFPEGNNEIVQAVALKITNHDSPFKKLIIPILLFKEQDIIPTNINNSSVQTTVISSAKIAFFAQQLYQLRKDKGLTLDQACELVTKENYFGMMLLKNHDVDGFVGGITFTTADILRPALQIIGPKVGVKTVTSAFIMDKDELFLFGDASVNLEPTAEQLVDIAKSAVDLAQKLHFNPINLALLSYSTDKSGKGPSVDKVLLATQILQTQKLKNTVIAGPIQFDAAWDPTIRAKKFPNLLMTGNCNVFIFPNLDAANIGYKIAQRLGGYNAIGPILLGLKKPVNDLSRGANADDIYYTTLITAIQTIIKN